MNEATVAPETASTPRPTGGAHRLRAVAAAILGVLAVLGVTATAVALWASATVLQSDRVADLAGEALADADVQTGLAAYITDQVDAAVDLDTVVGNVLPDGFARLAPAVARGTRAGVERTLTRLLERDDVQQVLTTVVERAHDRAMDLLQGDGLVDGVTVVDGEVTLNTLPLVARGLQAVQGLGLLQQVEVPQLSADGDPDEQIAELSSALGRDLPDGFGQLVVYQSDSLASAQESVATAQRMLALAKRAVVALVVLTVVLLAATMAVATRRWRALLLLGLGVGAAMALLRIAVRQVVDGSDDLATRPGARAAIRIIVSSAATSLLRLAGILLLVALVAVAVALLRRRWLRADLVLVAAVVLGIATVAVLGLGLGGLLVGVLVVVAVVLLSRWLLPPAPQLSAPAV